MSETETFGFDDLVQVRAPYINFYVLRDDDGLYLIDAGFIRGRGFLRKALKKHNWDQLPIRGVIVTHGHLDHILHVGRIAEETGAWIAAPRLDEAHYIGKPIYTGWAHVAGALEFMGRPALGFRKFTPTRFLDDGELIDVWHGLTTVHLPGHTHGHSGFYCEKLKLLFCADLFASYASWPHLPFAIFNSDGSKITESIDKALALDLEGVLPNHADEAEPEIHLKRLKVLANSAAA